MLRRMIIKWKIKQIVKVLKKCDKETQTECMIEIKSILRSCSNDNERKRYIDLLYIYFLKGGLLYGLNI